MTALTSVILAIVGALVVLVVGLLAASWAKPETWKERLETLRMTLEVLAIGAAGIWAALHYSQNDVPAHRSNFVLLDSLEWQPAADQNACFAVATFTFRSLSTSTIPVAKVRRRVWLASQPRFTDSAAAVQFLDYEVPPLGGLWAEDDSSTSGPFVHPFQPHGEQTEDLVWLVRKRPGIALFRVDLFSKTTDREPIASNYVWDDVCGGDEGTRSRVVRPRIRRNK